MASSQSSSQSSSKYLSLDDINIFSQHFVLDTPSDRNNRAIYTLNGQSPIYRLYFGCLLGGLSSQRRYSNDREGKYVEATKRYISAMGLTYNLSQKYLETGLNSRDNEIWYTLDIPKMMIQNFATDGSKERTIYLTATKELSDNLTRIKDQQAVTDAQLSTTKKQFDHIAEIKKFLGGKKTRKHKGIVQSGGNKGKLRKGYKYTGKKLKNGSAEIKKVKKNKK